MGYIYTLTNTETGMKYVGQSQDHPKHRWRNHRKVARRLENNPNSGRVHKSNLYPHMVEYGVKSFTLDIIEEGIPEDELDDKEKQYISDLNTLHPNGYNYSRGGGRKKHTEKTKKLMSKTAKEQAPVLIDKYRRDDTKGLPMYIVRVNKKDTQGYAINMHPQCKWKSFTVARYKSLDACKQAAIDFLEKLEASNETYVSEGKKDNDLPKGIYRTAAGYWINSTIKKVKHYKRFTDKNKTDEENLADAIAYMSLVRGNNK